MKYVMLKTRLLVLATLFVCSLLAGVAPVSAAPPENFQTTPLVTTGLSGPSGFEIAPDGRIFILERTGTIRIYKNGTLLSTPFADLPSIAAGDRGLIGVAFDPDFAVNCYAYFYYTSADDLLNRLVRYNACGDVGVDGPFVIFQTNSPSQELHVGGSIQFGPDGKMYFAVGDNGYPPNGQDLSNPHGKILRINKDGSIPADNPFVGQPGALGEIWAYGFRNPWRFQFDAATGRLFGGDVGDFSWEEVNRIEKGGNYGWPLREGYCAPTCVGTIPPIYAYPHAGFSAAVTGGPVYRSTMFPAAYQGSLFFGDYAQGFIKRLVLDEAGNSAGVEDFDLGAGSVVDMKVAPDGALYYLTYFPGRLYRVSYNTGNGAPTAAASADHVKGMEPLTVHFLSAGSSDPDNDPLEYAWDFGDGTTSTEANPVKTYTAKGTYTVELTVSDGVHIAQAVPLVIQVGEPPTVRISVPAEGSTYRANDQITYNAFANDAAGFDLDDAHISTDVIFHHDTHTHPFLDNLIGRANTFTIPDYGEAAANTWYRIVTTATDSNGLTATDEVNIYPQTSVLTIQSNQPGIGIYLDGVPYPSPRTVEGVVNFKRELNAAPIAKADDGNLYQFEGWSDGGAIRHRISTPAADTTFTAFYAPAPVFTAEYFANPALAGEPVLVREDPEVQFDWGDSAPDPAMPSDEFSVRWTKNQFFAGGRYRFTTATDDGVRLYVDGELKIDAWGNQTQGFSTIIDLSEGLHEIRMEYFEGFGGAYARLNWETTPDQPVSPPTPSGFQASYFNNIELTGSPALQRTEAVIDHVWDNGSPDPVVMADNFSARWTKALALEAGTYRFTVTADDGVRLYVDGELLIDQWNDQPATTFETTKIIAGGTHTLVMEYYERGGGAIAQFAYEKADEIPPEDEYPSTGYLARYWNTPGAGTAPAMPARAADLTRHEATVNHVWDSDSPAAEVNTDHFVARWQHHNHQPGTYRFTVTADDGVRLYLNDELVLDEWIDQGATTYTVEKTFTGGWDMALEYYENTGGAIVQFDYELIASQPDAFFVAEYWNTPGAGTAPMMPERPADLTRHEAAINNLWNDSSPAAGVNTDHFVARWTKTITHGGTYTLTTTSDDGIRVLANDVTVINQWNDHAATTHTATVTVPDNWILVIEYYENTGGAIAQFTMELDANPPAETPYEAAYWNLPGGGAGPSVPDRAPDLTRQEITINHVWDEGSPHSSINANHFIARWIKVTPFEAGTYRFTVTADDGVRVYLDGTPVIDHWINQAATTYHADMTLTTGSHELIIEYYEDYGGAIAQFSYEKIDD